MSEEPKIILASTSPYRKEAFEFLGIPFKIEASHVDEYTAKRPTNATKLVQHLAKLKAEAVATRHSSGIILGFDSVGYYNGAILEKPKNISDAHHRLQMLSGETFIFATGIHLINIDLAYIIPKVVITMAKMRKLSDIEISKYLALDKTYNTYAIGFDPLGKLSSSFVSHVEGCPHNLLRGFPIPKVVEMLKTTKVMS